MVSFPPIILHIWLNGQRSDHPSVNSDTICILSTPTPNETCITQWRKIFSWWTNRSQRSTLNFIEVIFRSLHRSYVEWLTTTVCGSLNSSTPVAQQIPPCDCSFQRELMKTLCIFCCRRGRNKQQHILFILIWCCLCHRTRAPSICAFYKELGTTLLMIACFKIYKNPIARSMVTSIICASQHTESCADMQQRLCGITMCDCTITHTYMHTLKERMPTDEYGAHNR